jgi:hypothetical protein
MACRCGDISPMMPARLAHCSDRDELRTSLFVWSYYMRHTYGGDYNRHVPAAANHDFLSLPIHSLPLIILHLNVLLPRCFELIDYLQ